MSVCPGTYSVEWKGMDARVLSPYFFLTLFPVYFAGLTSLFPYFGTEQKLKSVLAIALNHAVAI